jgi:GNAT superfamily N-acetyltransferase
MPYRSIPDHIRDQVVSHLQQQWGYGDDFILSNWSDENAIMYVLYSEKDFIACVAVDLKHNEPYLSNLYVNPTFRSQGYATHMLSLAEKCAKSWGFNYIKLWCNVDMVRYYTRFGWKISQFDTTSIMEKDIV